MSKFEAPLGPDEQEEGNIFRPRFGSNGLITAVSVDAESGEVLMLAHMNEEALSLTLETGKAHFFSRSRAKIWLKGESSGNTQTVLEMRTDCDQDAIVLKVKQEGVAAACHTGRISCFYRIVSPDGTGSYRLEKEDRAPRFDPRKVYSKES